MMRGARERCEVLGSVNREVHCLARTLHSLAVLSMLLSLHASHHHAYVLIVGA